MRGEKKVFCLKGTWCNIFYLHIVFLFSLFLYFKVLSNIAVSVLKHNIDGSGVGKAVEMTGVLLFVDVVFKEERAHFEKCHASQKRIRTGLMLQTNASDI